MRRIVGICGYKGSGKSEVAKYLVAQHGFVRFPFAGTLKNMLRTLGLSDAQVDGDQKEIPAELLGGKTPRLAMQSLGTEWGRDRIDTNLWVRAWKHNLPDRSIVVDDFRFFNEAESLLKENAVLWRITRYAAEPRATGWRKLLRLPPKLHPSEAYVNSLPVHHTLHNNRSVEHLHQVVDALLDTSLPPR